MFRWLRNLIGRSRGYGFCLRCKDSWAWKKYHVTAYSDLHGCFPLCQECWQALEPEARLPFYLELYRQWTWQEFLARFHGNRLISLQPGGGKPLLPDVEAIREAVLAGK